MMPRKRWALPPPRLPAFDKPPSDSTCSSQKLPWQLSFQG